MCIFVYVLFHCKAHRSVTCRIMRYKRTEIIIIVNSIAVSAIFHCLTINESAVNNSKLLFFINSLSLFVYNYYVQIYLSILSLCRTKTGHARA